MVVKAEPGAQLEVGGKARSYVATLLSDPSKTLQDCLPALTKLTKAGKR